MASTPESARKRKRNEGNSHSTQPGAAYCPEVIIIDDNDDKNRADTQNHTTIIKVEHTVVKAEHDNVVKIEDCDDVIAIKAENSTDDMDTDDAASEGSSTDNEGDAVTYSELTEAYPLHAAYHAGAQEIQEHLLATVAHINEIIIRSGCSGDQVDRLHQKVMEASSIAPPPETRIGLLGDAGAGKSSVINSLLDIPDLAKTSSAGGSCTSVATEYRRVFDGQERRFAARVLYFSKDEIERLFVDHIRDYEEFTFDQDLCVGEEEREQVRLRSETCVEILNTLFVNRSGFDSRGATISSLEANHRDPQHPLTARLIQWTMELLQHKDTNNGVFFDTVEEDSTAALHDALQPFVSSRFQSADAAMMWPIVKRVSVGVRGSRVLEHVIVADLPGVSDTNQIRVNATMDYLRDCDGLYIVSRIDRVITDLQVDRFLQKYAQRFHNRLAIICTRSEGDLYERMPATAREMRDKGYSVEAWAERNKNFNDFSRDLRRFKGYLKKQPKTRRKMLSPHEIAVEIERCKIERNKADIDRYTSLINLRNRHVRQSLKHQKAASFEIFCVSNSQYARLRSRENLCGLPQIHVSDTGIPQLRAYTLLLPAQSIWQALNTHLNHKLMALQKGFDIWANSLPIRERGSLLAIVHKPCSAIQELKTEMETGLIEVADQAIRSPLHTQAGLCAQEAIRLIDDWKQGWHWQSVRAFARNGGNHRTGKVPRQSWNEHLIKPTVENLENGWKSMHARKGALRQAFESRMVNLVEEIPKHIASKDDAVRLDMDSITQLINAHAYGIRTRFAAFDSSFDKEIGNTWLDATQDRHTGFFVNAMMPAYEASRLDSGQGVTERWYSRFTKHVTLKGNESPFANFAEKLYLALRKNARSQLRTLAQAITTDLEDLQQDFKAMCDKTEEPHPAEGPLRIEVRGWLETADASFQQAITTLASIEEEVRLARLSLST